MLDISFIRDNKARLIETCVNKNKDPKMVESLLAADTERREIQAALDELRAQQNAASPKIASASGEEKEHLLSEMSALKVQIKEKEAALEPIMIQFDDLLKQIPNVTAPGMPIGKDESENVVVRTWGTPREFTFPVKDHVDLGKQLNIIDCEKSSAVSGSRFYYLKGDAGLLQFAIVQHVFSVLGNQEILAGIIKEHNLSIPPEPFVPMLPPVIMRQEVAAKMDRLEPKDQRYLFPEDGQNLVGSAEHTMGPYHMDEVLEEAELPIRYIGYSTAFRREAGTYGKDMRGILRVHQFDKMEMETFTTPEMGVEEQLFIVGIQEYLVRSLGLPHRVVHVCTGDTSKPDFDQYDIETWIPSQNTYRETHTSDYMTDYQARRLNIKYKNKVGDRTLVHMNDATAFAISRILIAIIENYQNKDGTVTIPEVLRPYMSGREIIV